VLRKDANAQDKIIVAPTSNNLDKISVRGKQQKLPKTSKFTDKLFKSFNIH